MRVALSPGMARPRLLCSMLFVVLAGCGRPDAGVELDERPPGDAGPKEAPPARPPTPPDPARVDPFAPTWELPQLQEGIDTWELKIPQAALDAFAADMWAPEQPATFVAGGREYPANVRLRGASARTFPKKSWNVDLEDLRFEGREELNLVAEYQDSTLKVEHWAYDVMRAAGVPVPRTRYVRLILNGAYQGLYLDIEEVDKKFLTARPLVDRDANIYRAGGWDGEMKLFRQPWQGGWKKVTNSSQPSDDLDALLARINYTPEHELVAMLEEHLELETYLRLMAAETVFAHNYVEDARDYWVHDQVTGRWYAVPWDLNNADARFWPTYGLDSSPIYDHPLFVFTLGNPRLQKMYERRSQQVEGYEPTFSNLRTRIVYNPELRRRLVALVKVAREKLLDPAVAHRRIDEMHALIEPHTRDDPYIDQARFAYGHGFLKGFVTRRWDFVEQEIARWEAMKPGLVIDAVDPNAGWLELRNRGSSAVSIGGLVVTTYLRRAVVASNVPARTLQPGEAVRFTATQLGIKLAPRGELGLFDGKTVSGALDVLFYGPLPEGEHYVRGGDPDASWTTSGRVADLK